MKESVILVNSQFLGKGDDILGEGLLETFFTLLKQTNDLPEAVFFVNSGVLALTERSLASLHIKELEDKGVSILACKTCINYYEIEHQLISGQVSSMKQFIELASKFRVITL
ncbi:DsrE family protein [Anaerobacillus sp. CMMVII]|uniref:DsrE family protein n=1 Tax=Anaerobacillus sp. CMMVII TaxID=2755588 RepID=UPI0021B81DFB|nr:DsrE family protein [Anaerobacillus sp. CMMVII]MCT8138994.1 DsrE family protein [Anaerobacillus sp. CMMVII]